MTGPRKKPKDQFFFIDSTPIESEEDGAEVTRGAERPGEQVRGTNTFVGRVIAATDVAVKQRVPYTNPVVGAGLVTAAAANAVIADTGPLAAGTYYVEVTTSCSGVAAAGKHIQTEHRNAANAATVAVKGGTPYPGFQQVYYERVVVAANERIRVVQGAVVGAAAEVAIAHIAAYLLPV